MESTTFDSDFPDKLTFKAKLMKDKAVWSDKARCAGINPKVMYPASSKLQNRVIAKYCLTCPVARECLFFSLIFEEQYGVWGGTTERERSKILALINEQYYLGSELSWGPNYVTYVENVTDTYSKFLQ